MRLPRGIADNARVDVKGVLPEMGMPCTKGKQ